MDIVTLIQTLGFPIACVVALAIYAWKVYNNNREDGNKREDLIMSTLGEITATNKELAESNRVLVEDYKTYLTEIKSDVKDIKEKLK